ncbi:MAG TPA: hypothetical protein PLP11_07400 [Bacteroidales bacterium]|nr:hypothetical protein [Bacteroidales bacterium]
MMVLNARIEISGTQSVRFDAVQQVNIRTSVRSLTDTAEVICPRRLLKNGANITEFIRRGDAIKIYLGYGNPELVFSGYITKVNTGTPIKIECENEAWVLKQNKLAGKVYPKLNLRSFISEVMPGYNCQIADVDLGEVKINTDVSIAHVLEYFLKNYPVNFFFRDGVFYGVMAGSMMLANDAVNTIYYQMNWNTISDNLVYTLADDVKVQIVGKAILKDNTKLEYKEPANAEGCDVRTFLYKCTTMAELQGLVKNQLASFKVDKMTGSLTAFGRPFARKGDVAHILDNEYQERNDRRFYIESVDYSFGRSGYRQTITLGGEVK